MIDKRELGDFVSVFDGNYCIGDDELGLEMNDQVGKCHTR